MRNMIRWQPINRPLNCNPGFDRLFGEFMNRSIQQSEEETSACAWSPAVNILERENGIIITADLPGLSAENVEVIVDKGVLTLKGERTLEEAGDGETYHRVERSYGAFERSFSIPESVDAKKIEARFVNGEMTVTFPKRAESKPRSVKVNIATA